MALKRYVSLAPDGEPHDVGGDEGVAIAVAADP